MRLARSWAVRISACLALLLIACILEATADSLKRRPSCLLFTTKVPSLTPPEAQSFPHQLGVSPSGLHSRHSFVSVFPVKSPARSSFPTERLLQIHLASDSALCAKLSFLAPPDPITLDEAEAADGGAPALERTLPPPYVECNARYLRLSPIKTRRVIQELRGKSLAGALAHLATSPRRPAFAVFRAIESAIANAVNLHGDQKIKPQLVSVTATNGPVMKRPFFKARGRMNIWRRPTTHIKVIIKAF